jgi:hypothetical protein
MTEVKDEALTTADPALFNICVIELKMFSMSKAEEPDRFSIDVSE